MGTIQHNALILEIGDPWDDAGEAREAEFMAKLRAAMGEEFAHLLAGPVKSGMNGYRFLFIAPDGSKEGWDVSERGDAMRDRVRRLAHDHSSVVWGVVEVKWGELGEGVKRSVPGESEVEG